MANIQDLLEDILSARYGEEVRGSIHDAIEQCYMDGQMASVDLVARNDIANMQGDVTQVKTDIAQVVSDMSGFNTDVANIKNDIGDLTQLQTTAKNNLVDAINEAAQSGGGGGGGGTASSITFNDSIAQTGTNNVQDAIDYIATHSSGGGGGTPTPVLLWTNPNPNVAFVAQNIALNLSDYNKVVVKFRSVSNASTEDFDITVNTGKFYYKNSECYVGDNCLPMFAARDPITRPYSVSSAGVTFQNGAIFLSATGWAQSVNQNTYAIPYQIYGVK